jgi:hypothetical protein
MSTEDEGTQKSTKCAITHNEILLSLKEKRCSNVLLKCATLGDIMLYKTTLMILLHCYQKQSNSLTHKVER